MIKKMIVTFGITLLFVFTSLAITSCGKSDQKAKKEVKGVEQEHEHGEEGAMEMGEGSEEAGEHEHAGGGGHMKHMDDVVEWLKKELGENYDDDVPPVTEAQMARGEETFKKICAACHGAGGKGDGPAAVAFENKPADFTDPVHSKYYSDAGRLHIIKNGIPGTPMVGLGGTLNDEDIKAVYGYVLSLRRTEGSEEGGHMDGHDHGEAEEQEAESDGHGDHDH
jgi:mono/diheme cytochrome c family protein